VVAQNIAFYLLAAAIVGAAVRLVTTKNVVRAALFLAIVLGGTAGIFGPYVIPFEVSSILLLAALVGAVALARRD